MIVPYWIVLAVSIIIRLILGLDVSLAGVVFSFLNIQGIDRIFTHCPVSFVGGMGHTWFLTVLFFCYFMMLLLKRNPEIEKGIRAHSRIVFIITVVCQILLTFLGIQIIRPLCFFYGYFWNKE